jgi:flagellar motility protein MotE (MotC chaperone)
MKSFRDIRLLPVVLVAAAALVTLKVAGLAIDGGYVFKPETVLQAEKRQEARLDAPSVTKPDAKSWAQSVLNFPGNASKPAIQDDVEFTGSSAAPAPKPPETKPPEPLPSGGTTLYMDAAKPMPAAERAVLERLQERRLELDRRQREIDIRESLLKAAEQRIEGRLEEIKGAEVRVTKATEAKVEADKDRFKGLVTMYENMKPKDAARIFDRLDMSVLYEVAAQMKPQKLSDVLAQMQPDNAQRLTIELARAPGDRAQANADLPKIEGRPSQAAAQPR